MTADQALRARAPQGVTDVELTPGWRCIVGRRGCQSRTFYYHANDDPRLPAALHLTMEQWAYG